MPSMREQIAINSKRHIDEMTDGYIRILLRKTTRLTNTVIDAHPELITVKRKALQIKRFVAKYNQSEE